MVFPLASSGVGALKDSRKHSKTFALGGGSASRLAVVSAVLGVDAR